MSGIAKGKMVPTDAFLALPVLGIPLAMAGRALFPNQAGSGKSGHKQQKANVSDTDIARMDQGGGLSIGSKRGRTREGKTLSSFGTSGLRIPGGQ